MADLFDRAPAESAPHRAAVRARSPTGCAPTRLGGGHRPGPSARPRRPARPHARRRRPRLDRPLGTARGRQDHDRPPARGRDRRRLRPDQRDLHRRRRPQEDLRGRPPAPRQRAAATLLFVDEIHRFNRAQQDGFLPLMEDGTIVLVGATTENPSFELNAALLSRAQVLILRRLDAAALESPRRAAPRPSSAAPLPLDARGPRRADRDGRRRRPRAAQPDRAARPTAAAPLDVAALAERLTRRAAVFDKSGDGHYNLISALHKSVRGSDPDAALYWLARMLEGRRGSALPRPPHHPDGGRGHRPGRPGGDGALPRRLGDLRAARLARGRTRAGPGGDLPRARAEVERGLRRLLGRPRGGARAPARWRRRSTS